MVLALARWLNLLVHIVRHVVIMFRRSWGPSPIRDNLYHHKTDLTSLYLGSQAETRARPFQELSTSDTNNGNIYPSCIQQLYP